MTMAIATLDEAERVRIEALASMQRLNHSFPGEASFESIIAQLEHLGQFLARGVRPIPRAAEFNFGLLGMKSVREFDERTSAMLASLAQFVEDKLS